MVPPRRQVPGHRRQCIAHACVAAASCPPASAPAHNTQLLHLLGCTLAAARLAQSNGKHRQASRTPQKMEQPVHDEHGARQMQADCACSAADGVLEHTPAVQGGWLQTEGAGQRSASALSAQQGCDRRAGKAGAAMRRPALLTSRAPAARRQAVQHCPMWLSLCCKRGCAWRVRSAGEQASSSRVNGAAAAATGSWEQAGRRCCSWPRCPHRCAERAELACAARGHVHTGPPSGPASGCAGQQKGADVHTLALTTTISTPIAEVDAAGCCACSRTHRRRAQRGQGRQCSPAQPTPPACSSPGVQHSRHLPRRMGLCRRGRGGVRHGQAGPARSQSPEGQKRVLRPVRGDAGPQVGRLLRRAATLRRSLVQGVPACACRLATGC